MWITSTSCIQAPFQPIRTFCSHVNHKNLISREVLNTANECRVNADLVEFGPR
uniref:Uncharacterized protein n=1 Tax=Octopus bimaculoides TaxID=37653 RepID=A0A0L8HLP5_OCTBM